MGATPQSAAPFYPVLKRLLHFPYNYLQLLGRERFCLVLRIMALKKEKKENHEKFIENPSA